MARRVPLTLACGAYDINRALIDGRVEPDGIELTVLVEPSPERHRRMSRWREFDACELSMATLLAVHGQGERPFLAIPAFPHRRFRHSYAFVNSAAGIREPRDLEGRRVGLRTWQTTAGLWLRGILQDEHGVDLRAVTWVTQDDEDIPFQPPPGLVIERTPPGETVTGLLERGEIAGLLYPETPAAIQRGDPRVRRLFPDAKAAEIASFRRTGFFPIMHAVVVRSDVLERHPWVALNLLQAFERSRAIAFEELHDPRSVSLAWLADALAEQERILGRDPWSYAFAPNRPALATMIRWAHEQGLLPRPIEPEELFVPATLDALPAYV